MRLALVCPYDWNAPGGVQVHVGELAGRLSERAHDVIVIAPGLGPAPEPFVEIVGRPVRLRYNDAGAPIDPRPWSRSRVRSVLARFGPHVVHAHEPLAPSTAMWATLEARVPVVGTFHSGADRSRLYDVAAPVLRRVAARLAIRVAVSHKAEEFAAARVGGPFEIVPNGVDIGAFAGAVPADLGAGRKILFVGRLDERKGFPTAVATFERLARDRPDLRLIVVGDGADAAALEALPAELRERVTMLGAMANRDLPPIHAACDLYLGTSIGGESFGVVLVEAMAAGLPIVASDISGYDEVVRDGIDGLLVPPRTPAAAAAAAARILDDPSLAARLTTQGRARAARFDWSIVADRMEELYRRAADGSAPSLR
jgi:phosphatidyl-myo-inositol alpha-mannosyltransferase